MLDFFGGACGYRFKDGNIPECDQRHKRDAVQVARICGIEGCSPAPAKPIGEGIAPSVASLPEVALSEADLIEATQDPLVQTDCGRSFATYGFWTCLLAGRCRFSLSGHIRPAQRRPCATQCRSSIVSVAAGLELKRGVIESAGLAWVA